VTYRNYGHLEGDPQTYKAKDGAEKELAEKDCISLFRQYAIDHQLISEIEADEIEKISEEKIIKAIKFAEESPEPRPEALYEDVLA